MNANPYHVRLSISQYGDKLKAELFTEDLGDTEGEFLPAEWTVMEEWTPYLSQGAVNLPPDSARALGKELFNYLIGGAENSKKWIEILEQVKKQKRSIRLLIDAATEHVRDLPYGLLCEPHDDYFLLRSGNNSKHQLIQFVRILRRCPPRLLNLTRKNLRILVVAAEPASQEKFSFDCAARLQELILKLISNFDVYVISQSGLQLLNQEIDERAAVSKDFFEPFCYAPREMLKDILSQNEFDILHIIAHGQSGDLLLCDNSKKEVSVTSGEFGEWCRNGRLQMAFLQVCEASKTTGRGGFGGLAQQLINPKHGNLAAVVASSYPLDAADSTFAAIKFYEGISKGYSPDVALERNLDETNWSWAFLELWVRPSALEGVTNRGAFQFVCPYRGLSRFEERNADIFFGRTAETSELIQLLEEVSVTVLIGDTGSGKSSLLRAGVVNVVRQKGLLSKNGWEIITIEPGGNLRERLITALDANKEIPLIEDEQENASWQDILFSVLNYKCNENTPLLIIIDQFEEVFTLKDNESELHQICKILADFAAQHPDSFRLMLSLRSEFLGAAVNLSGLGKAISRPWVLTPPGADDFVEIIAEPAKHYGYTFEELQNTADINYNPCLLNRILSDPILTHFTEKNIQNEVVPVINPLPLLEFALERLWLMAVERGSQEFKHEDYENLEGLGGAIIKHAEDIYSILPSKFGPTAHTIAEQIFTSLVSSNNTRRPRTRGELESLTENSYLTREIIDYLVGERLLAIRSHSENLNLSYVDLIHEVLIERWDRFKTWLAENPELRVLIESFEVDSKRWIQSNRRSSFTNKSNLPGDSQARQYILWVDATKPALSDEQQNFVQALRKMRRTRKLLLSGFAVLILAALISIVFFRQNSLNRQHESRINLARNLQQKAIVAITNKDFAAAELFSAKALTLEEAPEQQTYLRELLLEARSKKATLDFQVKYNGNILDANLERNLIAVKTTDNLTLYDFRNVEIFKVDSNKITKAAISNDASLLAYGNKEGEIKVLKISDGTEVYSSKLPFDSDNKPVSVTSLAFNNDDQMLAAGGYSGIIEILNLKDKSAKVLKGHVQPAHGVAFSADSTFLASASSDDTARLWNVSTGKEVRKFLGHDDVVNSIAFHPKEMQIATGSADGTVRIWNADTGDILHIFLKQVGTVATLSYSHDGQFLAGAGEDNTFRLFDLASSQEVMKMSSCDTRVWKISFSGDSRKLFAGCNSTASIWTIAREKEVITLVNENSAIMGVDFSPDGNLLAGASQDSQIHIWDFKNKKRIANFTANKTGRINSVAYSPNGKLLLTAAEEPGKDGTDPPLKIWDVNDLSQEKSSFNGYEHGIPAGVFSPSETIIAAAGGYNNNVKIWDYAAKEPMLELSHEGQQIWNIAFSPDGQYIATAGDDNSVRLSKFREVADGKMPPPLYNHTNGVWGISFSPVQPLLASGSVDKSVVVWNLKDNKKESTFTGHTGTITSVAFDPSGDWLASASEDNTVRLWNLKTKLSLALKMHNRPVWWVAFSKDGLWLASCGLDKKIEVWNMREINSIYNSSPDTLFAVAKQETGLDIEEDTIITK